MVARTRQFPLHVYIATLFLALLIGFAAVSILTQYRETRAMLLSAGADLFASIAAQVHGALDAGYGRATLAVGLLAHSSLPEDKDLDQRLERIGLLVGTLKAEADLSAAYVGYDNGDFFLVRRLPPRSPLSRALTPPEGTAFLVQSVTREAGSRDGRFLFYDAALDLLAERPMPDYAFDPRERPWFKLAMAGDRVVMVEPYLFFTTREVGASFAARSPDGHAVVGLDLTLVAMSGILARLRPTPSAELVILNQRGEVVSDAAAGPGAVPAAAGGASLPRVDALNRPILARLAAEPAAPTGEGAAKPESRAISLDGRTWQTMVLSLARPGAPLSLAMAVPERELLAEADRIRNHGLLIALGLVLLAVPVTLLLSRLASRPINALTREARAVQALRFDHPVGVRSFIREIDTLAQAMDGMKSTIHRLLTVAAALGEERHFDRLLARILEETARIAGARGGTVHLAEPEGGLAGALSRWDDVLFDEPPADLDPLADADHPAMRASRLGRVAVPLTPAEVQRWYPRLVESKRVDGRPLVARAIRLENRRGQSVGVLTLCQEAATLPEAEEEDVMALVQAVSGIAAVAIESQRLLQEQKALFEALIELIAGAIDAKSPYTGGHCQRVPVLTEMLAHAAADATEGRFKDFTLTEDQWEELHIAAWLHDCGKLTTPEYVVDKATKLETIYDRLHEVRMRFEVIKREAEAACWQEIAEGAPREAKLAELARLGSTLDEEFAFVASCNEGGEVMAPERVERLRRIAERRWTRTLSERIGISQEELARKAAEPEPALPASEPLLADKPWHVVARGPRDQIAPDNPWGFKMEVPKALYDRGELHNLTQPRGTLTPEERFKINAHMVETIRMLTRLPLPRHLRNLPEIAGGHHERMDGKGYPRRLKGGEMSETARMMAIADVFEALTAGDRPYKKAMKLSQAIAIMARMRDEAHLDPDLFDLFLSAGVHLSYARRYLSPEQIDEVDTARYLRAA